MTMADSSSTGNSTKPKKAAAPRKPRATGVAVSKSASSAKDASKARFAKAIEEAKAGAGILGKEAQDRATAYRDQATAKGGEWLDEAKAVGGQAKDRATELAREGKTRASEAISSLGRIVEDNAPLIDEKVGVKYGDYARKAAASIQDGAAKLDAKDVNELGEDGKEFVRKSPGVAVGLAAAAGFLLARIFRKSGD